MRVCYTYPNELLPKVHHALYQLIVGVEQSHSPENMKIYAKNLRLLADKHCVKNQYCLPTAEELEALRQHMFDIAIRLDYYGGLGPWAARGAELSGAAGVMLSWVEARKDEEKA